MGAIFRIATMAAAAAGFTPTAIITSGATPFTSNTPVVEP